MTFRTSPGRRSAWYSPTKRRSRGGVVESASHPPGLGPARVIRRFCYGAAELGGESTFFLLKIPPFPLHNDTGVTLPDLFFVLILSVEILPN